MPEVNREDVRVTQDTQRLKVTGWEPARGDRAGLDLFILIDDASDSSVGIQLDDLRSFINAQPSTTAVGVGYMRNGTVQVTREFHNRTQPGREGSTASDRIERALMEVRIFRSST